MEISNLSRDMNLVAEIVGDDAACELMKQLGGLYIYIPKPGKSEIITELKANAMDVKIVARNLNVSQRKVSRILHEYRREHFCRYQAELQFTEY
ncbi:MAG: Mor transcription activator family protein [Rikenellaceae bacterium]